MRQLGAGIRETTTVGALELGDPSVVRLADGQLLAVNGQGLTRQSYLVATPGHTRPAQVAQFSLPVVDARLCRAPADCPIDHVAVRWRGQASATDLAMESLDTAVDLLLYDAERTEVLGTSATGELSVDVDDTDAQRFARMFVGADRRLYVSIRPRGTAGPLWEPATLSTDYVELRVRYRHTD